MIIGSGDLSPTSSGFTKMYLDENLEIYRVEKLGFYGYEPGKRKGFTPPKYKDIISYDETKYDFYNRSLMMHEYIFEFIKDCNYFIVEDYAMFGRGLMTQLAEFCSTIKFSLLNNGCKIRLVSPLQIKQFATTKGNSEKPEMYDSFISKGYDKILDISDLPKIPVHSRGKFVGLRNKKGLSPISDIVDSYHMLNLLHKELLIRFEKKTLDELEHIEKHVLIHTTKKNKIPLIKQNFIENTITQNL